MRYVPSICRSFHWIAVPHCSIDPSRPCASEACLWRLAVVSSMGVFLRMPDAGKGHSVCRQHRQKTASIRLSTPGPLRSPSMILGSCSPLLPSCVGAGTGPPSSRLPSRHANGVPARASSSSPLRARRKRSCLYRGLPSTTVFSSRNPSRRVRRLEKEAEPLRCALASCRMPTYDMVFCAGDKHHDVAAKPYSVDEHDAVRFAACGRHRPEFPEPRSEAPEGSRRHPHLGLALFDRSRSRSVLRSFAALSMLRVEVALQDMHCQRLEPDDVLPCTFRLSPHKGQVKSAIRLLSSKQLKCSKHSIWPALSKAFRVHVLAYNPLFSLR